MLLERQKQNNEIKTDNETISAVNCDFKSGDRVFHSKFGVGKVQDIQKIGSSTMIIVEFASQGKKALDSSFAQLKKF